VHFTPLLHKSKINVCCLGATFTSFVTFYHLISEGGIFGRLPWPFVFCLRVVFKFAFSEITYSFVLDVKN